MRTRNEFVQFNGQLRMQRFTPPKQGSKPNQAPQVPNMTMKTNAYNQYRGHGRGQ
jgi:hypothetical protein